METTEERVIEPEDKYKRYNVRYQGFNCPPLPAPFSSLSHEISMKNVQVAFKGRQ